MDPHKPVQHEMEAAGNNNDYRVDVELEGHPIQIELEQEIEPYSSFPVSNSSYSIASNSPRNNLHCQHCDFFTVNEIHFKRHLQTHTDEKIYECNHCDQCFTKKGILMQHEITHAGDKLYQCSQCDNWFSTKQLEHHHCEKCFAQEGEVVKHPNQETHSGEKAYHCSHCEKCFNEKSDMIQHQETHTREKPYKCSLCEECFEEKNDMTQHQLTHPREKPYNDDKEPPSQDVTDTNLGIVEHHGQNTNNNDETLDTLDSLPLVNSLAADKNMHAKIIKNIKVPSALSDHNCCIFCLDGGDLIHMCKCSVLAHKECAIEYISFPGSMNGSCCQCRAKLEYKVRDKDTPMKTKYCITFTFLLIGYFVMVGLSMFGTTYMIPSADMNIFLYVTIVANLGILWPLLLVFVVSFGLECCCGPRDRTNPNSSWTDGCYCSGGCGDCGGEDCNCCDTGGGGDDCGAILLLICLLIAILLMLIAATGYLIMSLAKYYKSFSLKSKKEIVFKHEGRLLNTIDDSLSNGTKFYGKRPSTRQSSTRRLSV